MAPAPHRNQVRCGTSAVGAVGAADAGFDNPADFQGDGFDHFGSPIASTGMAGLIFAVSEGGF